MRWIPPWRIACAAVLFSGVVPSASASLTHRYSFNDGTARDSVGSAHGVPVNGLTISNGQADFDNASPDAVMGRYIDLPNQIARTPALSLEAWFSFRGGGQFQTIATFGTGGAGELPPDERGALISGTEYLALAPKATPFSGDRHAAGTVRSDAATVEETLGCPSPLRLNAQHHVAFAVDYPHHSSVLYVDGQEVARAKIFIDPAKQDQVNDWLGRSQWSDESFYNGSINEFRIYDSALTANQAAASFAAGPDAVALAPEPSAAGLIAVAAIAALRRRRRAA